METVAQRGDLNIMDTSGYSPCGPGTAVFNSTPPSALEVQLQTNQAFTASVCNATTNKLNNPPYNGGNDFGIFAQVDPYFSAPPTGGQYNDMWAEEFSDATGYSGSSELPVIDHVISTSMTCSASVMTSLVTQGVLPTTYTPPCVSPGNAAAFNLN